MNQNENLIEVEDNQFLSKARMRKPKTKPGEGGYEMNQTNPLSKNKTNPLQILCDAVDEGIVIGMKKVSETEGVIIPFYPDHGELLSDSHKQLYCGPTEFRIYENYNSTFTGNRGTGRTGLERQIRNNELRR